MTPEQAIDKLQRMQRWGKMTDVKREALDMAIQAIESHVIGKECVLRKREGCLFFKDDEHGGEAGKTIIHMYCCPTCGDGIKMKSSKFVRSYKPFTKYCTNCGQKLKAPWKWHYEN